MPCFQTNRLIYEKLTIRPELLAKAVDGIQKELFKTGGNTVLKIDGLLEIRNRNGRSYKLNTKTGEVEFSQGMQSVANLVKRQYSLAAVQTVAGKSQIFRTFKLTQQSERKLTLTRR